MRRSKIFNPADMPTWWFILSAFLLACFFVGMVFLFALRFHLIRLAHADERPIVAGCSAGPDPSCGLFRLLTPDEFETDEQRWLRRYTVHPQHFRLVDNPDDGLVSGPTPQVCAPPETPRYPPGAGRGLLDPQRPERSFAR